MHKSLSVRVAKEFPLLPSYYFNTTKTLCKNDYLTKSKIKWFKEQKVPKLFKKRQALD